MSKETWRQVEGWPYEVSDQGRVRRSDPAKGTYVGRVLSPFYRQGERGYNSGPNGSRYLAVDLKEDGDCRRAAVHQLVAEAFLGPKPDGFEVDHINGNREDNRVENLRYVARAVNRGARLSSAKVREVRARYRDENILQRELAEEYGVSQQCISDIVTGCTRADV